MKNIKSLLLLLLTVTLFFIGCEGKKKKQTDPRVEKLSKEWEYHKVNIEGTVFPGEQMGSPRMDFRLDSSYTMTFQNMVDSGKWYFRGDTLVTTTFTNPGVEEYLELDSLSEDLVILNGKSNGKGLILTMKAVKE